MPKQPFGPNSTQESFVAKNDPHKILGIERDADVTQVKKAYHKLAKQFHPDKQGDKSDTEKKEAEANFKLISDAYKILSDPDNSEIYKDNMDYYDNLRANGGKPQTPTQTITPPKTPTAPKSEDTQEANTDTTVALYDENAPKATQTETKKEAKPEQPKPQERKPDEPKPGPEATETPGKKSDDKDDKKENDNNDSIIQAGMKAAADAVKDELLKAWLQMIAQFYAAMNDLKDTFEELAKDENKQEAKPEKPAPQQAVKKEETPEHEETEDEELDQDEDKPLELESGQEDTLQLESGQEQSLQLESQEPLLMLMPPDDPEPIPNADNVSQQLSIVDSGPKPSTTSTPDVELENTGPQLNA